MNTVPLIDLRSVAEHERDRVLSMARAKAAAGDLKEATRLLGVARTHARVPVETTIDVLRASFAAMDTRRRPARCQ